MNGLVRDPDQVKACLKELATGQLFVTKACKIQIPKRYCERGLAQIGIDTYVFGIFALIVEDKYYSVCRICAMLQITPFKVQDVMIEDVEYVEFHFKPNTVLSPTMNLVKRDTLMYNIIDEFVFKGNVPWFMEYDDLLKIYDTAKYHANSRIAKTYEMIEVIASVVARDPKDRTKYFRVCIPNEANKKQPRPAYVPMMSVFYSASSTMTKLAGAYFNNGVISALVQPTNNVDHIEQLLRA